MNSVDLMLIASAGTLPDETVANLRSRQTIAEMNALRASLGKAPYQPVPVRETCVVPGCHEVTETAEFCIKHVPHEYDCACGCSGAGVGR